MKHSADDLAQDEDADNGIVEEPADEEAFDIRLAAAGHPPGEGFRVGGWQHPASMERLIRFASTICGPSRVVGSRR
jgi:hypothetical protein